MGKTKEELIEESKRYMVKKPEDYNFWREACQFMLMKWVYNAYIHLFYKVKIYGKENLPKNNNYIVVANHLSTLDPTLIATFLPNPVSFMAKRELFEIRGMRTLLDCMGTFAVDREHVGSSTIRTAKSISQTKNWVLGLFPQGTRQPAGQITRVTKGFVGFAKSTRCNLLPIGIVGTENKSKKLFAGNIVVKIGKVIENTGDTEKMFEEWTKSIQELTGFEYIPE